MCYTVTLKPNSKQQEKIWVVKNICAPKVSRNEGALYQVIYHGHHMSEEAIAVQTFLPHLQYEFLSLLVPPFLFSAFRHWSSDSLYSDPHHATAMTMHH